MIQRGWFTLDYSTKSQLIDALSREFTGNVTYDGHIDSTNFIVDTISVDATASGLSIDTLKKTKNVIEEQEKRFLQSSPSDEKVQLLAHLRVAKKCVQEILSQKMSKENG